MFKGIVIWATFMAIIAGTLIVIRGAGGEEGDKISRAPVKQHVAMAPGVYVPITELPSDYCGV